MEHGRMLRSAAVAMVLMLGLAGCVPEPAATGQSPRPTSADATTSAEPAPIEEPAETARATFRAVVDGDTVETSAGTVRLIGIDTPERGECGHDDASTAIGRLVSPGDPVTLTLPVGQNDRDRHGRLLRYVTTDSGVDLGLMQLEAGNAVARYDSSDGYPAHPNEAAYHAAQLASLAPDRTVITLSCQAGTAPSAAPTTPPTSPPTAAPATDEPWWQLYSSCTRLKKNEVGHPTGPFSRDDPAQADIYDWFAHGTGNNGDGDGDGLACE